MRLWGVSASGVVCVGDKNQNWLQFVQVVCFVSQAKIKTLSLFWQVILDRIVVGRVVVSEQSWLVVRVSRAWCGCRWPIVVRGVVTNRSWLVRRVMVNRGGGSWSIVFDLKLTHPVMVNRHRKGRDQSIVTEGSWLLGWPILVGRTLIRSWLIVVTGAVVVSWWSIVVVVERTLIWSWPIGWSWPNMVGGGISDQSWLEGQGSWSIVCGVTNRRRDYVAMHSWKGRFQSCSEEHSFGTCNDQSWY